MDLLILFPLPILLLFSFFFGLFFGSFLNVLADRLPREETIMGRSYCEHCNHQLSTNDLIPVFSWMFLRGKCRYCNVHISGVYPLSELITAIIFALTSYLYIQFLPNPNLFGLLLYQGITSCFIVILLADFKYHIIPDEMQIALIILSFLKIIEQGIGWKLIGDYLLGGIVVLVPILLLFLITKGKGMGFGDVKLAFVIGFMLGLWKGLLALYIGFMSGAIIGLILILFRKTHMKSRIAFGPFLILGMYAMLFFSEPIVSFVKNLYGF